MKQETPSKLDALMYKRLGPHLAYQPHGVTVICRNTDHAVMHKLDTLRRKGRRRS